MNSTNPSVIASVRDILVALYRLSPDPYPHGRIAKVQREAIFYLYEGGVTAKWDLQRPHSAAARGLRDRADLTRPALEKLITYDHAIPLATLQLGLRVASASAEELGLYLSDHVLGVVITRAENLVLKAAGLNERMPPGAAPNDRLARYRSAGIAFLPPDRGLLVC